MKYYQVSNNKSGQSRFLSGVEGSKLFGKADWKLVKQGLVKEIKVSQSDHLPDAECQRITDKLASTFEPIATPQATKSKARA